MASVNQPIAANLPGANDSLVKLASGEIVTLARYQQLYDAAEQGSEPQIEGIIRGAGDSLVKLADGRSLPLSQFLYELQEAEEGSEPEVEAILNGAYSGQVQADGSITDISKLYIPEGGGASVEAEQQEVA